MNEELSKRIAALPEDGKAYLHQMLADLSRGDTTSLKLLREVDYEGDIVSPREFIEGVDYLGQRTSDLHERWKEELQFVLDPRNQICAWYITGAIGTGKTTAAMIAYAYKLHQNTRLRDPAKFYGLLPGSEVVFGIYNITLSKADSGYELLKGYIDECPYFKKHCPRRTRPDEPIYFPTKRLKVSMGSLAEHALGDDLLCIVIDEANFFKKVSGEDMSRAEDLFQRARVRQTTRFVQAAISGVIPGLVILISSRQAKTSFLEKEMKRAENDPHAHVTNLAAWETKDTTKFSGKSFQILIGTRQYPSRILEEGEVIPEHVFSQGVRVVSAPVEYENEYKRNVEVAIRDLSGEPTEEMGNLISDKTKIDRCIDHTRVHPFTKVVVDDLGVLLDAKIEDYFLADQLFLIQQSLYRPIINPNALRHAHVDIGVSATGDALGIAIGHIHHLVKEVRAKPTGVKYSTFAPYVYFDLMLKVRAPVGHQVDLEEIVNFFEFLRGYGMEFGTISYDSYQSTQSLQALLKRGFEAVLLSVDRDTGPYDALSELIVRERASYYEYEPFRIEIGNVQKDIVAGKVNHPEGGSKDVSDAAAGVAHHCVREAENTAAQTWSPDGDVEEEEDIIPIMGVTFDNLSEKMRV